MKIALLILLTATFTVALLYRFRAHATPPRVETLPTLTRVENLSTLVTTRINLRHDVAIEARGYIGNLRLTRATAVTLLLGPDLQHARWTQVDQSNHTATLVLPPPQVVTVTPEPAGARVVAVYSGLWLLNPDPSLALRASDAATGAACREAREAVQARDFKTARHSAEQAVTRWAKELGWTVRVQWPRS